MKKIISISLLLALTLGTFSAMPVSAEELTEAATEATESTIVLYGDANDDGIVDVADFIELSVVTLYDIGDTEHSGTSYYSEVLGWTDTQIENSDIDKDGKINSTDCAILYNYLLAIDSGYTKTLNFEDSASYDEVRDSISKDNLSGRDYFAENPELTTKICEKYKTLLNDNDSIFTLGAVVFGDANNDGSVDAKDAVEILQYYAENLASATSKNNASTENASSEFIEEIADINRDGVVDAKDAVCILQQYAEELANQG